MLGHELMNIVILNLEDQTMRWKLRRCPATTRIFCASQFGKGAILKDENAFSSKKKQFLFIIFSIFSNVQSFVFLPNKLRNEGWKHIFFTLPYYTHSTANLLPLAIFEKCKFFL